METKNSLRRLKLIRNQLKTSNQCPNECSKPADPVRVLVTGAAGQIGYALNFMIGQGRMFGPNQSVILHLFDLPMVEQVLKGVAMEINDCAFDLVKGIVYTSNPEVAFKDIDFGIFCGARPRGPGMERKDLLEANSKIFEEQGKYLEKYAKKTVKVVVVGNPANTNCLILAKNAPSININNFTAMTRLDQNRMVSQIGERLNVQNDKIKNVIIWGNHSATQYPDTDFSYIDNGVFKLPTKTLIGDDQWVQNEFIKIIQQRGAEIIKARKLSSAASAASSACDHIRDWFLGTKEGTFVSMAVYSRGEYGVPSDLIYSFPCVCRNGEWKIVLDLSLSKFSKEKMASTAEELLQEKSMALKK